MNNKEKKIIKYINDFVYEEDSHNPFDQIINIIQKYYFCRKFYPKVDRKELIEVEKEVIDCVQYIQILDDNLSH